MNDCPSLTGTTRDRPRVILDISILGLGIAKSIFRTGIHRVVENLALELLTHESPHLEFSAVILPGLANRYLKAHPSMAKAPLVVPNGKLAASKALNRLFSVGSRQQSDRRLLDSARWFSYLLSGAAAGWFWPPIGRSALEKADVFHLSFPFTPVPQQVRAASHVRVFTTAYDLIPILHPEYVGARLTLSLKRALDELRPSDWVLCISHSTRNDLLNYRRDLAPERVIVTHLAASSQFRRVADPTELARVRTRYQIPDGPYFLSLCNLAPHKNLANIIRGFSIMARQEGKKNINLVLAGTRGWQYERMFQTINEAKSLDGRIIVTGCVEEGDLAALFSGATAFVYLSRYEGFGLPCLEAMSCGIPVIASDTSSIPEVVGDAGILLDPDDLDGLAQTMLDVLRDEGLHDTMAQKALAQASLFSWAKCASETIAAYGLAMKVSR